MKKLFTSAIAILVVGFSASASAKCYHFDNSPAGVYVCVGKNGADSYSDRDSARATCSAKTGAKCGPVGSESSSCSGKCYDEHGNLHDHLSGY
jgi:hypothetical protein